MVLAVALAFLGKQVISWHGCEWYAHAQRVVAEPSGGLFYWSGSGKDRGRIARSNWKRQNDRNGPRPDISIALSD